MKICLETKENKAYFYKFDGKQLQKAIIKLKEAFKDDIKEVWSYSGIKRDEKSNIGIYEDTKDITSQFVTN